MSELIDPTVVNLIIAFLAQPISSESTITVGFVASLAVVVFWLAEFGGR